MPTLQDGVLVLTDKEDAAFQALVSQETPSAEQTESRNSESRSPKNPKNPRSPIATAFKEGKKRVDNFLHGDPCVKFNIPWETIASGDAVVVSGGKNGSWNRSKAFCMSTHGWKLICLHLHENLQPRRTLDYGQPQPLRVQFRLLESIDHPTSGRAVAQVCQILRYSGLLMSSDFDVELSYKYDIDHWIEQRRVREALLDVARRQGCKVVP